MGKLEEKMLNNVKNKKTTEHPGVRLMNVVSISYLFLTPMLIVFIISKYFIKNQDIFLTFMTLSFFCGVYNVVRELKRVYNQKSRLDEKDSEVKSEYF